MRRYELNEECKVPPDQAIMVEIQDGSCGDWTRYSDAVVDLSQLQHELILQKANVKAAEDTIEQLRVQLAGCGVAAMQDTREVIKDRAKQGDYGWSASYGDVCRMVDKLIEVREELDACRRTTSPSDDDVAAKILQALEKAPWLSDLGQQAVNLIKDLSEQVNHWRTKAQCYGDIVHGCSPALEAAGFPVDQVSDDGAAGAIKRAVEDLVKDRDHWRRAAEYAKHPTTEQRDTPFACTPGASPQPARFPYRLRADHSIKVQVTSSIYATNVTFLDQGGMSIGMESIIFHFLFEEDTP